LLRTIVDKTEQKTNAHKRDRMEQLAIQARLDTQERIGQVVDINLVMAFLEDLVIRTRNAIMAVPARCARKIVHKDSQSILAIFRTELARGLSELSQTKIADIEEFKKDDQEPEETEDGQGRNRTVRDEIDKTC
jgi:hypothetical protein